jgi:hypothetical protein
MDKNHGRAARLRTPRVGDDVAKEHRQHLITEPVKEIGIVKFVNRTVALLLTYLVGHLIYILWSEL